MLMPHANTVKHRVLRTGGHATAPENRTDQARVIPKTNKTRVVDHCAFWEPGDWVSIQKKKKAKKKSTKPKPMLMFHALTFLGAVAAAAAC